MFMYAFSDVSFPLLHECNIFYANDLFRSLIYSLLTCSKCLPKVVNDSYLHPPLRGRFSDFLPETERLTKSLPWTFADGEKTKIA